MLRPTDFFDLDGLEHAPLFDHLENVWQALPRLQRYLEDWLAEHGSDVLGSVAPDAHVDANVHVAEGARIESGAYVAGPTIIGAGSVVRHGAYIPGQVIVGTRCTVGHSTEIKRSVLLDDCAAPHFAYCGDSILGRRVNLGAGTKLSNLPMTSLSGAIAGGAPTIRITVDGVEYDTGLVKLGAILGDDVQTGCNAVTNPGCLVGRRTLVYSGVTMRKGYYRPDRIVKLRQQLEVAVKRE